LAKSKQHSCFISAPFGVDTSVLRRELRSHNVDWLDITTIPAGETFVDAIRSAIQRVDFLCVVVPASATGRWTLLEAGIAIGAGKPLLLIVDREAEIPFDVRDFHYALARSTDSEAIRFHLDTFLRSLDKKPTISRATGGKRSSVTRRRAPPLLHSGAESEIARLFEKAGFLLHEAPQKQSPGYEVDLAVWIDDLLPIFSSPILPVEVKQRSDTRARDKAVERLQQFLLETGTGVGLLVEINEPDEEAGKSLERLGPPPFVFTVSLAELRRVLRSGKFVHELIQARNRAVHGT
jgi:hypothetical protein